MLDMFAMRVVFVGRCFGFVYVMLGMLICSKVFLKEEQNNSENGMRRLHLCLNCSTSPRDVMETEYMLSLEQHPAPLSVGAVLRPLN